MKLRRLLRLLPPDLRLSVADIGSAGGLHRRWRPMRAAVSGLLFEPRDDADAVRTADGDRSFPFAAGAQAGRATLNITALPNMSSMLVPNAELLATYRKKSAHTKISGAIDIPVDTLDAVMDREGARVDVLKVDTQGSELQVLEGARAVLDRSALLVEVEVSFFQRYQGQPLLHDIATFMSGHGFELIELHRVKRYRRENSFGIGNLSLGRGQRAGRIAYGDAIFLIREDRLEERLAQSPPEAAEALALKTLLALLAYGKPDMAAYMLDRFGAAIPEPRLGQVRSWFGRMGKRPTGSGVLHHLVDYLARHV